jgi:transcriptional regulator with XRE-family HTH domain
MAERTTEERQAGRRLALIRELLHRIESQQRFAALLGVEQQRYNNWERGWPIDRQVLKRLCEITPGLTADYVLFGWTRGLTVQIWRKLRPEDNKR